jgi:putative ABC transport system permease protein
MAMDRFLMDLRFGARQLARSPGFTAAAVLVLAVGIGGSTAIFGAVDHILLRPLDLPDSDRLVRLCESHAEEGCFGVAPPSAEAWSERSRTLEAVGLARSTFRRMRDGGEAVGISAGLATPGLFRALDVAPARGRLLRDDDVIPAGTGRVAVVTDAFWRSELGGAPDVVGRSLVLDDQEHTIIGVLPADVAIPRFDWVRVWIPLDFDPGAEENRDWRGFRGYGRLVPGATVADAAAELETIQADLAAAYPEAMRGWGAEVVRMKDFLVGDVRPLLLLFLAAVGVVLLTVSVNLASILLARATTRTRELAVRSALGAGRAALVRQLLVEAGLLALLGGAVGVLVALWTTDALVALAPASVPRLDEVAVDGRVLAFALAVTAASAVVFGLAPVARLRRLDIGVALKDARSGGATRRDTRARRALVAVELALAVTLVLSAGLLLRSFRTLSAWDPGFDYDRILTFQVFAPDSRYESEEALADLYRRARQRLEAIPGVEGVGSASAGPLFGGSDGATPFLIRGAAEVPLQDAPRVRWYDAGPGYFPTLGMETIVGRNLREEDRVGSTPTALVNEAMARRYWPDGSPVGVRLSLPQWGTEVDVVGVVPDLRPFLPGEAVEPAVYVSNRQRVRRATFFILRTEGDPATLAPAVRAAMAELDPEMEPSRVTPLTENLADRLVAPRFNALLVSVFAIIALVLGAAGVYGVVAYAVALRTREFGIRMALGAARDEILRSVLRDGLRPLFAGLVAGLAGALLFTRLLEGLLHGVQPTDPGALLGTVLVLGTTALVASAVPALRASRTDPVVALRSE